MDGIEIKLLGSHQAGRCFWKYDYEVTTSRPLDRKAFTVLRDLGFLPNGQGFSYHQTLAENALAQVPAEIDWKIRVEPSGKLERERGDGGTYFVPFYTYRVKIEIDSGD